MLLCFRRLINIQSLKHERDFHKHSRSHAHFITVCKVFNQDKVTDLPFSSLVQFGVTVCPLEFLHWNLTWSSSAVDHPAQGLTYSNMHFCSYQKSV